MLLWWNSAKGSYPASDNLLTFRFAYYGLSGPFQNYIQYGPHDVRPGAIGLGQSHATGLNLFFQFWCYVTPIFGAIIADQYLGKYRAIVVFSLVYMLGLLILFLTSLPVAIEHGASLGGLVTAMIVIGLGTGGIKSNVSPLIAEQYQAKKPYIRVEKNGERVIVDPAVTIQRIYMIFYMCINIGSLSAIATTEMELHIGFWSAYLLPFLMFIVGFVVLLLGKNKYVSRPPKGSVILQAFKAMWIALKNKGNLDAAKPSHREAAGYATPPWSDLFIEELKRALVACRIFLFFPIYWLTYNQMLNNFISQAGQMNTHGIPNDIMQNIDPIALILLIPVFDRWIYPTLRKFGIAFKPVTRIAWGFFFGALAMAYAAIVQHVIYSSPPCYSAPLSAGCMNGEVPNQVHVAIQTPAYVFIAVSEIFASITGLEYAFTKAPPSMKSFIMSIFLFQSALGSALGEALIPTAVDPKLLWMYTGLAVAALLTGVLFWFLFKKYNATEESMNELEKYDEQVAVPTADQGILRRGSAVPA
jgi:POT family proton-dependent oligopeptide transporter